jgi:hypothetical protein
LKVGEKILPLALELDVIRLVRFQGGKHHESECAPSLQDRTMPGVLRQQRTLALSTWPLTDARARRIGEETNLHVALY